MAFGETLCSAIGAARQDLRSAHEDGDVVGELLLGGRLEELQRLAREHGVGC